MKNLGLMMALAGIAGADFNMPIGKISRGKNVRGSRANIRTEPKINRNEICKCGSGIKFKKCCLNKIT